MSASPRIILRKGWAVIGASLALLGLNTALAQTSSPDKVTADLRYEESNFTVNSWSGFTKQTTPFKTEPQGLSSKVTRGQFKFKVPSGNQQSPSLGIDIPILWDQENAKLYLDANRNNDLTDDPSYSALTPHTARYQTFHSIHLSLRDGTNLYEQALEAYASSYSSGASFVLGTRSCWLGRVSLQGTDWQVGVLEGGEGPGFANGGNGYLLLRPWTNNAKPFQTSDDSLSCLSIGHTTNLFLGKQAYGVTCRYVPGTPPKYQIEFTPKEAKLGEVQISGKNLNRLILAQSMGDRYTVVLDKPEGKVEVPVGAYEHIFESLSGNVQGLRNGNPTVRNPITIAEGKQTTLNAGGPLTNTVSVTHRGERLAFSFMLVGANGQQYATTDRQNPPRWTVYRGDKQVASGKFEFG